MADEESPLLPTHESSTSRMKAAPRPQRTVTFSPLTTVQTQSGASATSSLRPMQTPSSALSNVPARTKEPLLSSFNSKLRRRNSHGAALPSTQTLAPSGPRTGAQRTTRKVEKLKLLPNPEVADDEIDEESGRDVYSQFTRIKDPTARRDAARLGKADRERLPRVTAYCLSGSYNLDAIMKFMKSRSRTRGATPKIYDECIYSPYDYDQPKKAAAQRAERSRSPEERRSSPVQERIAQVMRNSPRMRPGERRYSDSAVEVDDNQAQRREELIDLHDAMGPPVVGELGEAGDIAVVPEAVSPEEMERLHVTDSRHEPSDISTEVHTPEVFVFDYGTVVIWGMTLAHEERFIKDISKFAEGPLPQESVQTEDFNFYYTQEYQARIYNDFISLRDPKANTIKLAISHALSQSVKTSLFEDLISETIESTSALPAVIAETGTIDLTRRQLNMQIGELFVLRINVHLQGSVLDSPELIWSEPQLEPVYMAVRSYLEIQQRADLLTQRVEVISDLLSVLREQGSRRHGEVLEWIVIVLIAAEILVAAINIVVDLYAGVD